MFFGRALGNTFLFPLILAPFWLHFGRFWGPKIKTKKVPERSEKTGPQKVTQAGQKVMQASAVKVDPGGGLPTKILRTGIGDPCKHLMTTPRRALGHGGGSPGP